MIAYCLVYSSTVKMEATCSSEKSVGFQRAIQHFISEDRTLQEVKVSEHQSQDRTMSDSILNVTLHPVEMFLV
jgi:hypothetical protein